MSSKIHSIGTFLLLNAATAFLLAGMGVFSLSQVQEGFAIAEPRLVGVVRPNGWLELPGIMLIATGAVLAVIALGPSKSRDRVLAHVGLFLVITLGLYIFLHTQLGMGRVSVTGGVDEVRSWLYFGFLGPRGYIPTGPDVNYDLLVYSLEYLLIISALMILWGLGKPYELQSIRELVQSRLRKYFTLSGRNP